MRDLAGLHIDEALDHPDLLGPAVRGPAWTPHRAFLKAVYGRPLTNEEAEIYRVCTGRPEAPQAPFSTVSLLCGRRSGKSAVAASLAVFEACFRDWSPRLGPGEQAVVLVLATTREQAGIVMSFIKGVIGASALLSGMVTRETETTLELSNGVAIMTQPANFRSVRGRSVVVAIFEECAFWRDDAGCNPDKEVLTAVRASQATFGADAKLIMLSSPYRRSGILFEHWSKWHGENDPRHLSWMAPTQLMNPTVPADFIADAFEEDPVSAASEFGTLEDGIKWRSDIAAFIDRETVEALIAPDRFELPPLDRVTYSAFVDAAGGSGSDSMTMCIAHRNGEVVTLDAIREVRPRFNPNDVVAEFADLLRQYRIRTVSGDRYAGSWVAERFTAHGISYSPSPMTKNEIYRNGLALLMSGRVELLDHRRLVSQLVALERRSGRLGDIIDHPRGGHDDVVNAALGAAVCLQLAKKCPPAISLPFEWK